MLIQKINCNNNVQYSLKTDNTPKYYLQTKLKCDTVSFTSLSNETVLNNLYEHIMKTIKEPNQEYINKILRVSFDVPKENIEEMLKKLTKYSNFDAIEKLKIKFKQNNITDFADLTQELSPTLSLNNAFSYLMKKEVNNSGDKALILDNSTIEYLSRLHKENKLAFEEIITKNKPVYIKNFENSYNVFNQSASFDEFAIPYTESAIFIPPEFTGEYLDGRIIEKIKELNLNPLIIDIEEPQNLSQVIDNLTVKTPNLEEFKSAVKEIRNGFDSESKDFLLEFLANDFHCFTPRKLGQKFKQLHKLIEGKVQAQNRPIENIFYTVPNTKSSFGIMNYMYKKANNLPDNKFIYWDGQDKNFNLISTLPEKSTIVIVDDAAISGASMFGRSSVNCFGYNVATLDKERPDINIIFAPIIDTEMSREHFKGLTTSSIFNHQNRCGKDFLIAAEHSEPVDGIDLSEHNPLLRILNPTNELLEWNTAILFPHGTPDNNAPALQKLIQKFYPNESYVKKPYNYSQSIYKNNSIAEEINKNFYKE